MKKLKDNLWIIGYGLSGGFGGINNYEVIQAEDEDDASTFAWQKACEEYENYVGLYGLRTMEEIMEEEEIDDEEEAEEHYNEEREGWLDYTSMPFTEENVKKVQGYHFDNPYEDITD